MPGVCEFTCAPARFSPLIKSIGEGIPSHQFGGSTFWTTGVPWANATTPSRTETATLCDRRASLIEHLPHSNLVSRRVPLLLSASGSELFLHGEPFCPSLAAAGTRPSLSWPLRYAANGCRAGTIDSAPGYSPD